MRIHVGCPHIGDVVAVAEEAGLVIALHGVPGIPLHE